MNRIARKFRKRSFFDLTHERKLSCNMGELIPTLLEEVNPGDQFKAKATVLVRFAPMVAPMMHRVNVFFDYFYVPMRILMDAWESFYTGGEDGEDATVYPTVSLSSPAIGDLSDYFGLPIQSMTVSALPFRAYAQIYNDWYRDTLLQDKVAVSKAAGNDTTTSIALLNKNWEKDYFTSARNATQLGPDILLPLGDTADVTVDLPADMHFDVKATGDIRTGNIEVTGGSSQLRADGGNPVDSSNHVNTYANTFAAELEGEADLSTATAASINDIRAAFQVQLWAERNMRGGSRLIEMLFHHFGVVSSDARLQRPEFLGRLKFPVTVSEVIQTSETDTTPQGNLAGHGYAFGGGYAFNKSFEEPGYIIGLMSIVPRTAYSQGIPRIWSRTSRLDFFWPEFEHLGEQAVYNREIYQQNTADDAVVFGYQGRYDELRRRESSVHGDFKDTLDYWHLGRIFTSLPQLNDTFIKCIPSKRVFADEQEDCCWVQILNEVKALKPMSKVAVPGRIDHG